jgi:hypothetical protein
MLDSLSYRGATRSLMTREIRIGQTYIIIGVAKAFGLGFHIDRYSLGLDLGPFYIWLQY